MENMHWENLDEGKTSKDFLFEASKHEKNLNEYKAIASYDLAIKRAQDAQDEKGMLEAKQLRESFLRRQIRLSPTRGFCLLNNEDLPALQQHLIEQADKRKLTLLRDHIKKIGEQAT